MKKIAIILSLGLAALVFAACNKEESSSENYVKYDGTKYEVKYCESMERDDEGIKIDFDYEIQGESTHAFFTFSESCEGKSITLGKSVSNVEYVLGVNGIPQMYVELYQGTLDGNVFSSGTVKVVDKDNGYQLKLDGTLTSGEKFEVNLFAPEQN